MKNFYKTFRVQYYQIMTMDTLNDCSKDGSIEYTHQNDNVDFLFHQLKKDPYYLVS